MQINKCPKCGNIYNKSEKYCSNCGAELQREEGADQQSFNDNKARTASKRRKTIILLLLTAALVIIGILLMFFILTTTFLKKEPVQIITPPSFSDDTKSHERLVQVLVDSDGKVYISLTGTRDERVLPSEKFREEVLTTAYNLYRNDNPNAEALSPTQIKEFSKIDTFGVPMKDLRKWLDMSIVERNEMLKKGGIPIESNSKEHLDSRANEFQKYWLTAIKKVVNSHELEKCLLKGQAIAIKARQEAHYNVVQVVMDNLQTANLNKFILMTSVSPESEDE